MPQIILFPPPELVPRALHRASDALADLRTALDAAQTVADVYPLWDALRALAVQVLALTDAAGDTADRLQEE